MIKTEHERRVNACHNMIEACPNVLIETIHMIAGMDVLIAIVMLQGEICITAILDEICSMVLLGEICSTILLDGT